MNFITVFHKEKRNNSCPARALAFGGCNRFRRASAKKRNWEDFLDHGSFLQTVLDLAFANNGPLPAYVAIGDQRFRYAVCLYCECGLWERFLFYLEVIHASFHPISCRQPPHPMLQREYGSNSHPSFRQGKNSFGVGIRVAQESSH